MPADLSDRVDLRQVYQVLRSIAARNASPLRYGELSRIYERETGDAIDPHLGWNLPLLQILEWCGNHGLPPLSALVIGEDGLPGRGFWGQPGTPPTPSVEGWTEMCRKIYATEWPPEME
jgi:hypothetical protein